jgi:hypothetical protein
LVGVAVNVTEVPAQIAPEGIDAILTLTGRFGLTVITIAFDVAGLPVAQVAVEVISTVITLPFSRVVDVYVASVSPGIAIPPFFHW